MFAFIVIELISKLKFYKYIYIYICTTHYILHFHIPYPVMGEYFQPKAFPIDYAVGKMKLDKEELLMYEKSYNIFIFFHYFNRYIIHLRSFISI